MSFAWSASADAYLDPGRAGRAQPARHPQQAAASQVTDIGAHISRRDEVARGGGHHVDRRDDAEIAGVRCCRYGRLSPAWDGRRGSAHRPAPGHAVRGVRRPGPAGNGPPVMAALRNLTIAIMKMAGHLNIAAVTPHHGRDTTRTLATLGLSPA